MESVQQRFNDLTTVIDQVHALFDEWHDEGALYPTLDEDTLHRLKLAVHEWLANLVQHAGFDEHPPEILLDVNPNGSRVTCVIEDNSQGFDLDARVLERQDLLERFPERGMGLLMLQACTQDLSYRTTHEGRYRLEFSVSANEDPWLNIPF